VKVRVDATALRRTRWYGHILRFAIGGVVTVATGLVAKVAGPMVGGVFLAFPAIFPIGLATIERLENRSVGPTARGHRARRAARAEAAGAAMGALGLTGFALVVWLLPTRVSIAAALAAAVGVWALVAFVAWHVRRRIFR
jgi:hypothetical protein